MKGSSEGAISSGSAVDMISIYLVLAELGLMIGRALRVTLQVTDEFPWHVAEYFG